MLYQLYETQRALMAPFSEFSSATAKLYSHPLSPFAHVPMAERVSAGFDLMHRLAKEYEKPQFDITAATVGDVEVKTKLAAALNMIMEPWRERRAHFEARPELVREALAAGADRYRASAQATMERVRHALKLNYLG